MVIIENRLDILINRAINTVTYLIGTTTTITGHQLYDRFSRHPYSDKIRGGDKDEPYKGTRNAESFDTQRQVSIYQPLKPDDPQGSIYLHSSNLKDYAICRLSRQSEHHGSSTRMKTVPVRVAIDGKLQDLEIDYPSWKIKEGQKLQAWIGGNKFEERDLVYGDATVIWTSPLK